MRDQTDTETTKAAVAVDPYGDVALGVECAWPESIHLARGKTVPVRDGAGRTDAAISVR